MTAVESLTDCFTRAGLTCLSIRLVFLMLLPVQEEERGSLQESLCKKAEG